MLQSLLAMLQKKYTRHVLAVFCVVAVLIILWDHTYAQGIIDEAQKDTFLVLENLVSLMSWLWIIPATLAWGLMSNTMAYGQAFFLDRYLFTMWQLMRSFSLFALGFIFIGSIIKNYVTFWEVKNYYEIIKKTVLAWLLISMSWYLLAAVIDLSIIATSAVAWVPLVVMEDQFKKMEWKLHCYDTVVVKKLWVQDQLDISVEWNKNELTLEQIMPQWDSVSWPLVFLWCWILNLSDTWKIAWGNVDSSELLLSLWLKLLINLSIVLPMIILMVVNMMRIFFIWLRAMFAPIIALDYAWWWPLTKDWGKMSKWFSPKNVLWLVFQPVAIVACMSIAIMLIIWMYDATIWWETFTEGSMETTFQTYFLSDNKTQVWTWAVWQWFINGTLLEKSWNWIWWMIWELIMLLFCITVFWTLIKVWFSASEITKWISGKMFDMGKEMIKSAPIVPTWAGTMSLWALERWKDKLSQDFMTLTNRRQSMEWDRLSDMLWMSSDDSITATEMSDIEAAARNASPIAFLNTVKDIQSRKPIQTSNSKFRRATETWLRNVWLQHIHQNNPQFNINNIPELQQNIDQIRTWNDTNHKNVRKFLDSFLSATTFDSVQNLWWWRDTVLPTQYDATWWWTDS